MSLLLTFVTAAKAIKSLTQTATDIHNLGSPQSNQLSMPPDVNLPALLNRTSPAGLKVDFPDTAPLSARKVHVVGQYRIHNDPNGRGVESVVMATNSAEDVALIDYRFAWSGTEDR